VKLDKEDIKYALPFYQRRMDRANWRNFRQLEELYFPGMKGFMDVNLVQFLEAFDPTTEWETKSSSPLCTGPPRNKQRHALAVPSYGNLLSKWRICKTSIKVPNLSTLASTASKMCLRDNPHLIDPFRLSAVASGFWMLGSYLVQSTSEDESLGREGMYSTSQTPK
jgi:hypothetical protein